MKISLHNFGNFKLDGGAMFGPVPKPVWSKLCPADQQNRIVMASNTLLLETNDRRAIIDLGMGSNFSEKIKERYAIADRQEIPNPETITDVILTHLHFDHTGGLFLMENNQPKATYPNARYHVQKQQWEAAEKPSLKEHNAYNAEDLNFLRKQKLNLIQGEKEIIPGVHAVISNGHTKGLQWLKIKTNRLTVAFISDLIPTAHHLNLAYHMSYEVNADVLLQEKQKFLEEAIKEKYVIVFQHDPSMIIGQVIQNAGEYQLIKGTL